MNILKLELKKTNIKPYFLSAIAVFDRFDVFFDIGLCHGLSLFDKRILWRGCNPLIQLSHKSQICCMGKSGGNFAFHQHRNVLN